MSSSQKHAAAFALLLIAGFAAGPADAESIWLEPAGASQITLEVIKPAFAEGSFFDVDFTTFTLAYFLSGRFAVSDRARIVVELPVAHAAVKNSDASDTAVGNLLVGGEFGNPESGAQGVIGVRLPMAPQDNIGTTVGAFTDYVDRFEAFLPDVLTVTGGVRLRNQPSSGLRVGGHLLPLLLLDTSGSGSSESELFFSYGVKAWYENELVGVGGGFSGRYFATADGLDFGQRTNHQLGLFANFKADRWRPGIQLRVPLDEDLKEVVATEVSVSLGVVLD